LEILRETIKRGHPLWRFGVAAGVVMVVVGVLALSTATRRPYSSQNSVTWHIAKASRMNLSACHEPTRAQKAEIRGLEAVEPVAAARWPEETSPCTLPVAIRVHHFRSPPVLS
jgi:hypothetical protein